MTFFVGITRPIAPSHYPHSQEKIYDERSAGKQQYLKQGHAEVLWYFRGSGERSMVAALRGDKEACGHYWCQAFWRYWCQPVADFLRDSGRVASVVLHSRCDFQRP
ncbi:hypothetical protein [Accumulibacter sp.]|uniref:hypothetical protein n=1 Tax=Accumulibacter sp. TaxID=2053492 RepID=UPI0035AE97B2